MAGLPTNQRDQVLLGVAILGIVGAGLYWNFVHSPRNEALQVTRDHIERLDASNQKSKAIMAKGTVEELQAEAKRLQDNLGMMRTLIPAGTEVPTLIDQVIGAARRTGLQFANFAPGGTVIENDSGHAQPSLQAVAAAGRAIPACRWPTITSISGSPPVPMRPSRWTRRTARSRDCRPGPCSHGP